MAAVAILFVPYLLPYRLVANRLHVGGYIVYSVTQLITFDTPHASHVCDVYSPASTQNPSSNPS